MATARLLRAGYSGLAPNAGAHDRLHNACEPGTAASLNSMHCPNLRTMVKETAGARVVRDKQALESLVGHLVHAATVFPLGKAFLNALFATKAAFKPGWTRRLNLAARSELAWWDLLLEHWSGMSVHQFLLLKLPDRHLFTDASGSWGC